MPSSRNILFLKALLLAGPSTLCQAFLHVGITREIKQPKSKLPRPFYAAPTPPLDPTSISNAANNIASSTSSAFEGVSIAAAETTTALASSIYTATTTASNAASVAAIDAASSAGASINSAMMSAVEGASVASTEVATAATATFVGVTESAASIGIAEATASAALIVAAGALATKKQETNTVSRLQKDRDSLEKKLSDLEDKVFEADLQFEQTSGAMREEFQTTLKVKLDTLRSELRREKDMAIKDLKQAQESQLEELKEYVFYVVFSGHSFVSMAAIAFYLPACKQILDQALH